MFIHAYAALAAKEPLQPFTYTLEFLDPFAVEIAISHCSLCHSDIHLIDNDWGISTYPLVPGHEIIGKVTRKGASVDTLQVGDRVGVSWQLGACLECSYCKEGDENLCSKKTLTCVRHYGGFADKMIADSRFAFPIPTALPSEKAAPLLCAGATVFSPLKRYLQSKPMTVGIIGVGGLGHLAIQFAKALGYQIIALSHSMEKQSEALALGAQTFIDGRNPQMLQTAAGTCDLLLNTAHADLDWNAYLTLLKPRGTLCFVGKPPSDLKIPSGVLISGQKQVSGSTVANRKFMREMLDFAAANNISPTIELFPMSDINLAIEKLRKGEIRYRAVLQN